MAPQRLRTKHHIVQPSPCKHPYSEIYYEWSSGEEDNGKEDKVEEVYCSKAIMINNAEGTNPKVVNGQRIKHYISSTPINVETNIIQTMTPEEYIKETF